MPIQVLLVEDSPVALAVLTKILERSPEIEIVGTARTGIEALSLIPETQPQVVCTDLHMPHMDGLTLTSEIMTRFPLPILVVSVSVQPHATQKVFELLAAGAVDVFPKPVAGLSDQNIVDNAALIEKIKILAGVKVFKRKRSHPTATPIAPKLKLPARPAASRPIGTYPTANYPPLTTSLSAALRPSQPAAIPNRHTRKRTKIIAIGASTGGPQALETVLSQLPKNMPPIICVQHIGTGFLQGLIQWMQASCALKLGIAQPGEPACPGHVYFAPENQHLRINHRNCFSLSDDPPIEGHRPSVSVAFDSIAQQYGAQAIGVLLTGMGGDGATGLKAIAQTGGLTLAQDEATSVVFGMPKVAIELGAVSEILPIENIAATLVQTVTRAVDPSSQRQNVPTI